MAGYISAWSGSFSMKQKLGTYWSSSIDEKMASSWEYSYTYTPAYVTGLCADGKSVRCVAE